MYNMALVVKVMLDTVDVIIDGAELQKFPSQ